MSDISSQFLINRLGEVAIVFDDPAFVRAETVLVDRQGGHIHALLHEKYHHVGSVSGEMVEAFSKNPQVLLAGVRVDGTVLDLHAAIVVIN
ncbi:MAG: hypothetical protein KBC88_06225 [Alphaproteobacteria bacterium]|jgi:hypothetical protein|nr:hypothetical protein [Alphaproteobacteria bacterium]MBP9868511.1 hypothetical protein [Alphaproteobacteria bacterium]